MQLTTCRRIAAVGVLNPDDEVTRDNVTAMLDQRPGDDPVEPGVTATETSAAARAVGEV